MDKLDTVMQVVSALRSIPDVARERRVVAYEVQGPVTVYVRATHCEVSVHRALDRQVQVEGDLRQAFGWDWVVDHDEAGVYVVLKRKPVVGALSTASLKLTVPPDAYLVFNLTPGRVMLADFDGRLSVAPLEDDGGAVNPASPED